MNTCECDVQEGLRNLFSAVGQVRRVSIVPVQSGRNTTYGYVCLFVVVVFGGEERKGMFIACRQVFVCNQVLCKVENVRGCL